MASASPSRPGALALAVALAAIHALWSLFQWTQLVLARRGGDFFCGLGEAEGCATVWDLPLANAIQGWTGLPVAGWGLVWSVVAFALPLWALVRRARGHPLEPVRSATLLTVLAGVASVVVLAGASFAEGVFCDTCVVTYGMVLAYSVVCLRAVDRIWPSEIQRGALLAMSGTLVAFLVLLYPGLRTPGSEADERSAFIEAARSLGEGEQERGEIEAQPTEEKEKPTPEAETPTEAETTPAPLAKTTTEAEEKPAPVAMIPSEVQEKKPAPVAKTPAEVEEKPAPAEGSPDAARLEELIARLSPELRQDLSDSLAIYSRGDLVPLRPARLLIGSPEAPVRITEFTDALCSHCASLHETVTVLREMLPSGSFSLEPRQFPLDSKCNPAVEMSSGEGVRCLAARAMICLEKDWMQFATALFEQQRWLTKEGIYKLAAPHMSRERFENCITSPETQAKLHDDIAWAVQHNIRGTPLLLVNGREVPGTLQFLYAMVLAEANPEHPAFDVLPPPHPQARLH